MAKRFAGMRVLYIFLLYNEMEVELVLICNLKKEGVDALSIRLIDSSLSSHRGMDKKFFLLICLSFLSLF